MNLGKKIILAFLVLSICISGVKTSEIFTSDLAASGDNYFSDSDALEFLESCLSAIKLKDTAFLTGAAIDEQYVLPTAQDTLKLSLSKQYDLEELLGTISIENRVKSVEGFKYEIFDDMIERVDEFTVKIFARTKDVNGENQGHLTVGLRDGSPYLLIGYGNKKLDYTDNGNIIGYSEAIISTEADPSEWSYHHESFSDCRAKAKKIRATKKKLLLPFLSSNATDAVAHSPQAIHHIK